MPVLASRGARAATAFGLAGDGFPPAALALFARMSPAPSPARKTLISQTISALIIAGVWQKLDLLQLFAADAQANALLNWIGNSYNSSVVNTPTFTTDRGFTGVPASTSYLRTGYTPSSGPKWGQNDHAFGRWLRTGPGGGGYDIGAFENATLKTATIISNVSGPQYHAGDSGGLVIINADPIGSVTVTRNNSSTYDVYENGSLASTVTSTSRAGPPLEMFALAYNLDGTPATITLNQVGAIWVGQALSAGEILALHNAIQNYMTGVGA